MKMFMAALATETNSFSPMPTGDESFKEVLYTKRASYGKPLAWGAPLNVWRKRAEEAGWDVVESLATFAQPAGPTIRTVYEAMRDDILHDLQEAMPVNVVLLSMHGAMIAEGYDDCEGDLLTRTREIVGPTAIIGLEIDPHCHLTDEMMAAANLIICFKEYPHTDIAARADDLFELAAQTVAGKVNPVMRDYDCRMITMYQTPNEPMRSYVDHMSALEGQDGILSVSLAHGFPWGDSPRVGTRTLVIADGDAEKAANLARDLGQKLWELRENFRLDFPDNAAGLDHADAANDGPVVLADFADNAGAGAPSDSTYVLREVLDRGLCDVAMGIFWDPVTVRMCSEAGVGAVMNLRIGGKICPQSGDPVDVRGTVRAIKENHMQHLGNTAMPLGTSVWFESGGVHLLINDTRSQVFHPEAFTDLGMDLSKMKIVIVKSSQHFFAGFSPIASEIIHLSGPGAVTPDFTIIPYTKRDGNYWPKVDKPFASD